VGGGNLSDEDTFDDYQNDDYWDDDYWDDDFCDEEAPSIGVFFANIPEVGLHPVIINGSNVFTMTSRTKRRGDPKYFEIEKGDGGLNKTSFLNLEERHEKGICAIQFSMGLLSVETSSEIIDKINRLHNLNQDDWE
jgi:hypothetical protein